LKRYMLVLAAAGVTALSAPLAAQGTQDPIPPEYRPPAGMCRIWLNGVPPSRQPEATDCPTAVRRVPPNGRVVFGPDLPPRPTPPDVAPPPKKGGDGTPPVKRLKPEERRKPGEEAAIDHRRLPALPRGIRP
jgi:hypothetical protein